ncbi:uncharacterized protein LOC143047110 [Mytilus galloprovincialis]|uniref:uncharacterized protein LOC143047110 n=1 Tax=Mytilus galloprovincialis TaxID=29158 RepID=UPI003F7B9D63
MASSKPISCGPCHIENINIPSDIWCYNCDKGLCSTCLSHHQESKSTCDHKTIDIKNYKPSIPTIKTECDEHNQDLNLYCPNHLMPCCNGCVSTKHSKCTQITNLASIVEKTSIENSKKNVETSISSTLLLLDKFVTNKTKNIKTGENQCVSINKSIKGIRQEINKHLDELDKKSCQETDTIWNQEKSKAADFISELEGKIQNLNEMKENLQTVTEDYTSKLQSFLGVHQIEQQVNQYQRYVEDLEKDERTKELVMEMKQNDEIEKILSTLGSLNSLGEVMVFTTLDLNKKTSERRDQQVQSQAQYNIQNMKMSIETRIDIKEGKKSDLICLMDDRLIIVEKHGKVNLLFADGELQKELPKPGDAYNVTQISQDTIAVTYPKEKAIKIVNMEREKVTKVIPLHKECYGLSFSKESLVVGLSKDEICFVDLEGTILNSIEINESQSDLTDLVFSNDTVIYTCFNAKICRAVYCVDGSGKQIWQYKGDLSGPRGLSTDTYGNIFVTDIGDDIGDETITVISKDGQSSKELIDGHSRFLLPNLIRLKQNGSSGYICHYHGKKLIKFNLSSG